MRMVEAAEATMALAIQHGYDDVSSDIPELDYNHTSQMVQTMRKNDGVWSEAKMGRWLGWLQAAVVSGTMGAVTLQDCKQINMEHSDDSKKAE